MSIIICNYNYGRFLRAAIDSALAQTYGKVEVIVVDDGSTDTSRAVIDEFAAKGAVKALYQDNQGQCSAYNAGFAASAGDIVLFLDADDLYLPEMAERVVAAIDANAAKAHFKLSFIGPQGELRSGQTPRVLAFGAVGDLLATKGVLYSSAPGSGNAYARRALAKLFPLPITEDRYCADFFTVYGSALNGTVVAVNAVLGRYRLHGSVDDEGASLAFANAATYNAPERLKARIATFRSHVRRQLGVDLPPRLVSFSTQKQEFVRDVFRDGRYLRRLWTGQQQFADLWHALRSSPDFSLLLKSCIAIWAVLVIVLPRAAALPLARYVTNPASR
ncbi:glycosyltransferase family A protein [Ramlibacter tataouinensis]|uniref:glycosyltransferase family 2 protein n=1 Tax=Ramlibacter tataouinensis TaxID=94132 RepID=UPI0022F3A704|nr:glycosyltransferase family A protein [Ramlibacter tataouinensis]WBY00799.1 glycosyltransferase family A protein [Ramlibacter tataouinensis]